MRRTTSNIAAGQRTKLVQGFEGGEQMKKNLLALAMETPLAMRRATKEWGTEKGRLAQERAPYKTGALRRSLKVTVSVRKKVGKENVAANIKFGGADAWYAAIVHEVHPTQKKYLERTMMDAAPTAGAELAEKLHVKRLAMGANVR